MLNRKVPVLLITVACALVGTGCHKKESSTIGNCKPVCEVAAYDKMVKFDPDESNSWKAATAKITDGSAAQTHVRMDAVGKSLVFSHTAQSVPGDEEVAISHTDVAGSTHHLTVQASHEAATMLRERAVAAASH